MRHGFSVALAERYGVEAAVVIHGLSFWVLHNKQDGANAFEGRTWTYNTYAAWAERFPYFKPFQIRRILLQLAKDGVILKRQAEKQKGDCTNWYAFADEAQILAEYTRQTKSSEGLMNSSEALSKSSEGLSKSFEGRTKSFAPKGTVGYQLETQLEGTRAPAQTLTPDHPAEELPGGYDAPAKRFYGANQDFFCGLLGHRDTWQLEPLYETLGNLLRDQIPLTAELLARAKANAEEYARKYGRAITPRSLAAAFSIVARDQPASDPDEAPGALTKAQWAYIHAQAERLAAGMGDRSLCQLMQVEVETEVGSWGRGPDFVSGAIGEIISRAKATARRRADLHEPRPSTASRLTDGPTPNYVAH